MDFSGYYKIYLVAFTHGFTHNYTIIFSLTTNFLFDNQQSESYWQSIYIIEDCDFEV